MDADTQYTKGTKSSQHIRNLQSTMKVLFGDNEIDKNILMLDSESDNVLQSVSKEN